MSSIQTCTLHARGWQSCSPKFSPLMYSHTPRLCINSAHRCHLSHCEGLLLTLTSLFSVLPVHLKSLFLADVTGQLVLLNKKSPIMQTCFSLLLVWIFTFLLFGFPSACRSFLPSVFFIIGFSSWALIPRCLCCVSSSVFVELKAFFLFLNPLPAYLWFFFFFFLLTGIL